MVLVISNDHTEVEVDSRVDRWGRIYLDHPGKLPSAPYESLDDLPSMFPGELDRRAMLEIVAEALRVHGAEADAAALRLGVSAHLEVRALRLKTVETGVLTKLGVGRTVRVPDIARVSIRVGDSPWYGLGVVTDSARMVTIRQIAADLGWSCVERYVLPSLREG